MTGPPIPLPDMTLLTNAPGERRVGGQVQAEVAEPLGADRAQQFALYVADLIDPDEVRAPIQALRAERPEPEFRISLRTGSDPQGMDHGRIRDERERYEAAGVSCVVCAPWRKELDGWLRSMELLTGLVGLEPR